MRLLFEQHVAALSVRRWKATLEGAVQNRRDKPAWNSGVASADPERLVAGEAKEVWRGSTSPTEGEVWRRSRPLSEKSKVFA